MQDVLERPVLCPIAIDDSWKTCDWWHALMDENRECTILDFSCEEDFEDKFRRLLEGLTQFYGLEEEVV